MVTRSKMLDSTTSMEQLSQQLIEQRHVNRELQSKIEDLQIALESADVNYELMKQKCLIQFEDLQNEMANLRLNQRQLIDVSRHQHIEQQHQSHNDQQRNSHNFSNLTTTITTMGTQDCHEIRRISNCVEENSRNISEIDLRLQLLENTRYNGHLIWKIDDFRSRRQRTLTGEINALHSAPCMTSDYGYKFCLKVYLNGDGAGENTHLSLFLVIMKSDYDNMLEWPFQHNVTLALVNQQNRKRDIVKDIIPNRESESFHKPKKDYNIASGLPMFVSIEKLESEGFLKDDCIFFDVKVQGF